MHPYQKPYPGEKEWGGGVYLKKLHREAEDLAPLPVRGKFSLSENEVPLKSGNCEKGSKA